MARKNKNKDDYEDYTDYEDEDTPDEDLDDIEDDLNPEKDSLTNIDNDNDDMPANPMGLAHQLSKESEQVKYFKELPKEVRFSFLDNSDKLEIKHYSRTYRSRAYIDKIIDIRELEDKDALNFKKTIIKISSKEDLKNYLKKSNRDYLINDLEDLEQEEIDKIINHIKTNLKPNEFLNSVENRKASINKVYDLYREDNLVPVYIDDSDNLGKIMDTSISSMGFKGNAAGHSVMTINAVKNEDIQKAAEEKTKFSFLDAIKRKLG